MLSQMMRAARLKPALSFRATYTNTADLQTYSFANCDIGGLSGAHRIVVVVVHATSASNATVSSIVIGGVTSSLGGSSNVSTTNIATFGAASSPTGTTATIDVTFSQGVGNCTISVYAIYSVQNLSWQTTTTQATGTSRSVNFALYGRYDIVIACITYQDVATATTTWTGVNEYYDADVETRSRSNGGVDNLPPALFPASIRATTALSRTARLSAAKFSE